MRFRSIILLTLLLTKNQHMKKSITIFLFLFSLTTLSTFGQAGLSMSDSSTFLMSGDTLTSGTTVFYAGTVFNNSNQTYTGNITYYVGCDSTGSQGTIVEIIDSTNVSGNTISPFDTITHIDSIPIGPQFKSGINTVVIWPVADAMSAFVTLDSAKIDVFVIDPLKITNTHVLDQLVLYPNPFSDKIWLLTKGNLSIEEVRIMDALGRVIYTDKNPNKSYIETGHLSQGVYLIELIYNGGKKQIKTMKQ